METTEMSINQRMDKGNMVFLHNGILLGRKKEWDHFICSNMDGPRHYDTKWSKSEKDKYRMI